MKANKSTRVKTDPPNPCGLESPQDRLNQFISEDMLTAKFPQFPAVSVRWWIRNRKNNGLAAAVLNVNRKILIHVPAFCDWLKSHAGR